MQADLSVFWSANAFLFTRRKSDCALFLLYDTSYNQSAAGLGIIRGKKVGQC